MSRRNSEKYRTYQREYKRRKAKEKKAELIKLLGGRCWMCKLRERLRVDHLNGRLICEPCLYDRRRKDAHGTLTMYRYCKCYKCREAKSQYMKAYLKKYRAEGRDRSRKNYKGPVAQR